MIADEEVGEDANIGVSICLPACIIPSVFLSFLLITQYWQLRLRLMAGRQCIIGLMDGVLLLQVNGVAKKGLLDFIKTGPLYWLDCADKMVGTCWRWCGCAQCCGA